MIAASMALKSFGPSFYEVTARAMSETFSNLTRVEMTPDTVASLFQDWALLYLKAVAPMTGIILAVGFAIGLLQSNFHLSLSHLALDFSRLNPLTGLSRLFSLRTLVETGKGILKLSLIGFIAYRDFSAVIPEIPNLMGESAATGVARVSGLAVSGLQTIGFALLALGVLDYGYQYWEFRKSMRMTKQEIKQEHKEQEGNPELKQKQRQKQREMARRRKALKDVPLADVVITNPTHFAIALKYDADLSAPKVLAKGSDLLAQRIKIIAKQHEIPMVENRQLARTLYATVDVGKAIPPELYQAVAEVLAFVYSIRRQQRQERFT